MADREIKARVSITKQGNGLEETHVEAKKLEASLTDLRAEFASTEAEAKALGRAVEVAGKKLGESKTETAKLRNELKELEKGGVLPTSQSMLELSGRLRKAEADELEMLRTTRKLAEELRSADGTSDEMAQGLGLLIVRLNKSEEWLSRNEKALRALSKEADEATKEIAQQEAAIEQQESALQRSVRAFKEAQAATIALKTEFKKLGRDTNGTVEDMDRLSREIHDAERAEFEAIETTRKLIGEMRELGSAAGHTETTFRALEQQLDRAARYNSNFAKETQTAFHGIGISGVAMGNIIADGIQEAAYAIKEFTVDSYKAFAEYEDLTQRVFAQIPGMSADMRDSLADDARVIAVEIGRLPQEVIPAMRKAMNLGIDENNLLEDVRLASIVARTQASDLTETLVTGQSAVNAYGGELYNLSNVYDYLTYVTNNSNLEMDDMNQGLNAIISAGAEARVGLADISAAMVTMNRQGDDAQEITQLLSNMLIQLSISGTAAGSAFRQAAGEDFTTFMERGGSLAEAMQILQNHADDTGDSLMNMVGGSSPFYRDVQAARAIVELTGRHIEDLAENSRDASNTLGTVEQAAIDFGETHQMTIDQANSAWADFKIAAGEALAVSAKPLLEDLIAISGVISGREATKYRQVFDQFIANTEATGEWENSLRQLAETAKETQNDLDTKSWDEMASAMEEMTKKSTVGYDSFEEWYQMLIDTGVASSVLMANLSAFDLEDMFNEQVLLRAGQIAGYADQIFQNYRPVAEEATKAAFNTRHFKDEIEDADAALRGIEPEQLWRVQEEMKKAAEHAAWARSEFGTLTSFADGLAGSIDTAAESYRQFAVEVAKQEIMERLKDAPLDAALAFISLQESMGLVTAEEASALEEWTIKTAELNSVTEELFATYMEDGVVSKEEMAEYAEIIGLIESGTYDAVTALDAMFAEIMADGVVTREELAGYQIMLDDLAAKEYPVEIDTTSVDAAIEDARELKRMLEDAAQDREAKIKIKVEGMMQDMIIPGDLPGVPGTPQLELPPVGSTPSSGGGGSTSTPATPSGNDGRNQAMGVSGGNSVTVNVYGARDAEEAASSISRAVRQLGIL